MSDWRNIRDKLHLVKMSRDVNQSWLYFKEVQTRSDTSTVQTEFNTKD